jgi:polar amino acid transport system permease protein
MVHILSILAEGIGQTVAITAAAFALGAVIGFPLALMRRSPYRIVRAPAAAVIEILRSIPPIVWLFIVYYGIGTDVVRLSTFQGAVVGLGLIASAYLAEIYRAGIDAVARGQWEASKALGLPRRAMYQRVILPQALVVVTPPAATFAIGLLKDSAIASVIGATDITFRAVQETQANLHGLTVFAVAGLLYIALSLPIAALARYTDRILARKAAA